MRTWSSGWGSEVLGATFRTVLQPLAAWQDGSTAKTDTLALYAGASILAKPTSDRPTGAKLLPVFAAKTESEQAVG